MRRLLRDQDMHSTDLARELDRLRKRDAVLVEALRSIEQASMDNWACRVANTALIKALADKPGE